MDLFLSPGGDGAFVKMGVKTEFIASSFPSGWRITEGADAEEANEEEPRSLWEDVFGRRGKSDKSNYSCGSEKQSDPGGRHDGGGSPRQQQPRLDRKVCGNAQAAGQL